jgi:hypothetical protein
MTRSVLLFNNSVSRTGVTQRLMDWKKREGLFNAHSHARTVGKYETSVRIASLRLRFKPEPLPNERQTSNRCVTSWKSWTLDKEGYGTGAVVLHLYGAITILSRIHTQGIESQVKSLYRTSRCSCSKFCFTGRSLLQNSAAKLAILSIFVYSFSFSWPNAGIILWKLASSLALTSLQTLDSWCQNNSIILRYGTYLVDTDTKSNTEMVCDAVRSWTQDTVFVYISTSVKAEGPISTSSGPSQ